MPLGCITCCTVSYICVRLSLSLSLSVLFCVQFLLRDKQRQVFKYGRCLPLNLCVWFAAIETTPVKTSGKYYGVRYLCRWTIGILMVTLQLHEAEVCCWAACGVPHYTWYIWTIKNTLTLSCCLAAEWKSGIIEHKRHSIVLTFSFPSK